MFDFIKTNENIYFTKLDKEDLIYIMNQINKYYLEYRSTLNLPEDITFGVEIEYEDIDRIMVRSFIDQNFEKWWAKPDASITIGGEISSPIMHDEENYWQELKSICKYLNESKANTSKNAGGHVHIGSHILNNITYWRIFLKIYTLYEPILFRFFYGDKINARNGILKHAHPIANELYFNMKKINEFKKISDLGTILRNFRKNEACNFFNIDFVDSNRFIEYRNIIEFRSPNATVDEVVWQNNINVIAKILLACINNIDEEYLDYKLKGIFKLYKYCPYIYDNIDLDKSFEFIDIIFDNTLDKIYFLRQYVKDYQVQKRDNITTLSKRFTK